MLDKFRRHIDAIEPSFKSRPPCTYKLFKEQSETKKLLNLRFSKNRYVLFFVAEGQNECSMVRTALRELALKSHFNPIVTLKQSTYEQQLQYHSHSNHSNMLIQSQSVSLSLSQTEKHSSITGN